MTIIFQSTFSHGDFSDWAGTFTSGTGALSVKSNNLPVNSNYNMESTITGGGGAASAWANKEFTGAPILYNRFYVKWNRALAYGESVLLGGLYGTGERLAVYPQNSWSDGEMYWGIDSIVSGVGEVGRTEDSPSLPVHNTWYCCEILRDVTNQRSKLWVDGALKIDVSEAHSTNTYGVLQGIYYVDLPDALEIYSGNVVVSDEYIGPTPSYGVRKTSFINVGH